MVARRSAVRVADGRVQFAAGADPHHRFAKNHLSTSPNR